MASLRPHQWQLPVSVPAHAAAAATNYRRTCRDEAHVFAQEAEARDLLAVLSPASEVARQSLRQILA